LTDATPVLSNVDAPHKLNAGGFDQAAAKRFCGKSLRIGCEVEVFCLSLYRLTVTLPLLRNSRLISCGIVTAALLVLISYGSPTVSS
jgi:hypothetical protein